MTILTDPNSVEHPMTRDDAHELCARLATQAYDTRSPFTDVLLADGRVSAMLGEDRIREASDPFGYIGRSKDIIRAVAERCYQKPTFQ